MHAHRILLVDDHPVFRGGLRRLLEEDPRLRVVAEAASGHEALRLADVHRPALVILDVQLPGVTGLQVARALRRQRPTTRLVFLSMHVDAERIVAAIRVGAAAFLAKDAPLGELLEAVRAVLQGEDLLRAAVMGDPRLARRVLAEFRAPADGSAEGSPPALSPRELEVLDCLVHGMSNKEIGDALFITEQTVKNHMTAVLRKLQVDDRVAALRYAVTHGWAEVGPQPYAAVERAVGGGGRGGSSRRRADAPPPPATGDAAEAAST